MKLTSRGWDVLVVGSVNLDYVAAGPRLPGPGETASGESFLLSPGGKGANQAVAAARLGARVALCARIGLDEPGSRMLKGLRAEGVDTRHVRRDAKAGTGTAVIMVDHHGQKQIMTAPGANQRLSQRDAAQAFATHAPTVLLLQLEVPLATVEAAVKLARRAGCLIVLDPAPPTGESLDHLLPSLDLIRPNSHEAEALTGVRVTDQSSARRAASLLLGKGVRAAAVQAGDEGDLMLWSEGEQWLPRISVRSVDATGAGDAFAAGLATALAQGLDLREAGFVGSAAAALATTKLGAQSGLPTRAELVRLLRKIAPAVAKKFR